jgi:hypothetical protein
MRYLQISDLILPGDLSMQSPFKALVIAEDTAPKEFKAELSRWLVSAGCLYMMAWGEDCRAWQDAVNLANLQAYNFGAIPDDALVITTSHPDELLSDVFWFAKYTAMHPCASLENVVLLHLSADKREAELTTKYESC